MTERIRDRICLFIFGLVATVSSVVLTFSRRTSPEAEMFRLIPALGLKPGSQVAEIGAGKGQFTLEVARYVGASGHVWSTELNPKRLEKIRKAAAKAGLENVTAIEGAGASARLPDACCDAIFMRGVYHHFTQPEAMDQSLRRALKAGGRLVVIDFTPRWWLAPWTPKGIPANRGGHGIPKQILKDELIGAGFEFVQQIDDWPHGLYAIVVTKRPAAE